MQAEDLPVMTVSAKIESICTVLQKKYQGVELKTTKNTMNEFQAKRKLTMTAILQCLDSRFNEKSFMDRAILQAADVFDPTNLPATEDEVEMYGNDKIDVLSEHFHITLNEQGCNRMAMLKLEMFRNHRGSSNTFWKKVLMSKWGHYSNILHLVQILMVCPAATAQVESQFSFINPNSPKSSDFLFSNGRI